MGDRRSRGTCITRGCGKPTDGFLCVDCDVRGLLLTVNRMMMLDLVYLARPIPPKSSPEQIAADDAAAKVLRRKIRVVK